MQEFILKLFTFHYSLFAIFATFAKIARVSKCEAAFVLIKFLL
jgi:hypothetical protein